MLRFGDYVLLERLGQGAGGTVHLARRIDDALDRRLLVIKVLHEALLDKPTFVQRFRHEGLIAVSVNSPHVAEVHDVGRVGDAPYIAMEYVEGKRLIDVLRRIAVADHYTPLDILSAIVIGGLDGLTALHEAVHPETHEPLGAVHRDVSPSNLILSYEGHLKLIDLGLGKSNVQDWQTRTGAVLGSLGYMAPEQVLGGRVDHRADIYALSAVFYELLALEPYVQRGDRHEMLRAMEAPKVRPPSARRPDVPPALDALVAHGLAHAAEDRFPAAAAMRQRLAELVPPAPLHRVATFLFELVGPEHNDATSRVKDLLAQPIKVGPESSKDPTVVFARRHSTIRTLDDVEPSYDDAHATAVVATQDEPQRTSPRAPTLRPQTVAIEISNTSGVPLPVVAVLLIVAVVLTVMIDRLVISIETPAAVAPVEVPKRNVQVTPTARAPEPPAVVEEPPAETTVERTLPKRRRTARTEAVAPAPSENETPPKERVHAMVRSLTARSESLRRRHPEREQELDAVLTDISVWSASRDYARALAALTRIDQRLDRIATP